MQPNNKIMNIFIKIIPILFISGCVHPHSPKIPFNSDEVSWAKKSGNATIKGCVSSGNYMKYHSAALLPGNYLDMNNRVPIESSYVESPEKNFTIDMLPKSDYMHDLSKKMYNYLFLNSYYTLNDPRWVDPAVLPYIPHISCPDAGQAICPSIGHFVFPNLPAGNWYIVTGYNATPGQYFDYVDVQEITTIAGQTVPFIAWTGVKHTPCTP
ncbi:hypothetical protein LV564_00805 (plasmid) [Komagataeibacter nataicola]|uniref:hypothetical protein n=1 Tax=Komagataeibacter nataicola TaxID=265960 RepID=UPI0023DD5E44|nr:hypothetical protein [Komagataeibacter nataicola]WEQ54262.1 hypothetical protein LV564_00805 [Komagataeibacter nataicola]